MRPCCTANVADGCRLIFPFKHEHDSIVNTIKHLHPSFKSRSVQFERAVEVPQHETVAADADFPQILQALLLRYNDVVLTAAEFAEERCPRQLHNFFAVELRELRRYLRAIGA